MTPRWHRNEPILVERRDFLEYLIRLPGGKTMWMDDKTNVLNVRAMVLLREAGGHPGDAVVGDVLICQRGEVS